MFLGKKKKCQNEKEFTAEATVLAWLVARKGAKALRTGASGYCTEMNGVRELHREDWHGSWMLHAETQRLTDASGYCTEMNGVRELHREDSLRSWMLHAERQRIWRKENWNSPNGALYTNDG
ncbi:MAG: hypothetical protein KBF73_00115 [Flavobacteriales bacterium]|nr:hypothetical protein [Flavobacteriales bacterium]